MTNRAWFMLICAVLSAIGLGNWLSRTPVPPQEIYAFNVPLLFPTCMEFVIPAFERFGNFDIHQPMRISLETGSHFYDSRIEVYHWCGWNPVETRS